MSRYSILFLLVGFFAQAVATPSPLYSFATPAQQQQFTQLTEQLRCLVCQNESLADSTAPLARDLKTEIYQKVQSGADNETIKQYLLARYGQFILFKPAFNPLTYALWLIPFLLLVICFGILIALSRRRHQQPPSPLTSAEKAHLSQYLDGPP